MMRMLVAVGNPLAGDDGVAAKTAECLRRTGADWQIVEAGLSPENVTGVIRREKPDLLVIVDAARMGAPIGAVLRLPTDFADKMLLSTHGLPLPFLIDRLREAAGRIVLVGIEPKTTQLGDPLSERAARAAEWLAGKLASGEIDQIPSFEDATGDSHR